MSCNIATAPVHLGQTVKNHLVFSTKVRNDKLDDILNILEHHDMSSWNLVAVTLGQGGRGFTPRNPIHDHCDYPGYGPV